MGKTLNWEKLCKDAWTLHRKTGEPLNYEQLAVLWGVGRDGRNQLVSYRVRRMRAKGMEFPPLAGLPSNYATQLKPGIGSHDAHLVHNENGEAAICTYCTLAVCVDERRDAAKAEWKAARDKIANNGKSLSHSISKAHLRVARATFDAQMAEIDDMICDLREAKGVKPRGVIY